MRRTITFTLFVIVTLVLGSVAACTPKPQATPSTGAAANATPQRVVFLLTQPFGGPFEGDIWDKITQARKDGYAADIKLIEMKDPTEYEQTIRQVSEQGYNVVVSTYFFVEGPFTKVAPSFPNVHYVLVNDAVPEPQSNYPNIRGIVYDEQEGSYVCGVVAGKMTTSNRVGFIGGSDDPGIRRFLAGYEAGLKSVKPEATLDIAFAGTFIDPDKGHEMALALYDRGDDIVMHAANKTGLGVFVAATEKGHYAIGVDVDQSSLAPSAILCSALSNPGASVYQAIKDAATGKWTGGTISFGLDDNVPASALNKSLLPAGVITAAQDAEAKIKSGAIKVPVTTEAK